MKSFLFGAAVLAALAAPAQARNFAVPDKNPAVILSVPDKWDVDEIEYGYSAKSPDGGIFFSVEYAGKKNIDRMVAANKKWMKENKIDANVKPQERQMDFGGTKGEVVRFDTTDANGKTLVDFVFLDGGGDQVVMLTLWGSEEERADNKAAVAAIMASVKPIN
ncbi:hypothetical protein [Methylobacterium oryzihabitans]|uniref:DUF1795 domain-containing protein n=1 Tax=Methylobacterium oryzihabitans TaxID=2499852 RepID=A0A3S2VQH5_9HYPH|nr:hypothetical protein [Methylobacterium oryzihabitans]RVU14656.1 hypothetical protein EOE48_22385 [Methylobacterium oryzihabitans]